MKDKKKKSQEVDNSKRKFLKNTGYTFGGIVLGSTVAGLIGVTNTTDDTSNQTAEVKRYDQALTFFTKRSDFLVLESACERIYPEDDHGPGARELGAGYFIDRQLSGAWGNNSKEYMRGPFLNGIPEQGYQTHLKRNEIIVLGIEGLKIEAASRYKDEKNNPQLFYALSEEEQDEILADFEAEKVELNGVSSSLFFTLLINLTIQGVYSDPLYGGNKNMEGWKMKNFPGAQMSYIDLIDKPGPMPQIEPQSLKDHM